MLISRIVLLSPTTRVTKHQQRKNSMLLEAFFSTVASPVIAEVIKEMIRRVTDRKPTKEKDVEEIIDRVLRKYSSIGQSSIIEREIIIVLGNAGLVGSHGQLLLSPSHRLPSLPDLLGVWWDNRVYKIVSVCSESAVSVLDWRTDNGAPIVQWDYLDGTNQQWKVIPVGGQDNLFKIHSCYSAKVLDVPDPRMEDGTPLIQWVYHGGTNQQWRLLPMDRNGEIFKITSEWSGKSLDVPNPRTDNGAPLIQWSYHGGTNQQWRLMQVK